MNENCHLFKVNVQIKIGRWFPDENYREMKALAILINIFY